MKKMMQCFKRVSSILKKFFLKVTVIVKLGKLAKKRGLSNFKTTPQALKLEHQNKPLFILRNGIMNHIEVEAL
jgi:hypothetical protein